MVINNLLESFRWARPQFPQHDGLLDCAWIVGFWRVQNLNRRGPKNPQRYRNLVHSLNYTFWTGKRH
jgi:hypothetical protein